MFIRTASRSRSGIVAVGRDPGLLAFLRVVIGTQCPFTISNRLSDAVRVLSDTHPDVAILETFTADGPGWQLIETVVSGLPRRGTILVAETRALPPIDLRRRVVADVVVVPGELPRLTDDLAVLLGHQGRALINRPLSIAVAKAVHFVGRHYARRLRLDDIARNVMVSPSHLAHSFRTAIGMSVMDFVTAVRIEATRPLLVEGDEKLDHIAEAVGFCDAPHLSRVFQQRTGLRPGAYRRSAQRHTTRIF